MLNYEEEDSLFSKESSYKEINQINNPDRNVQDQIFVITTTIIQVLIF